MFIYPKNLPLPKWHRNAFNHIFTYTALLYTKTGIFQRLFSCNSAFFQKNKNFFIFSCDFLFFSFFVHTDVTFQSYILMVLADKSESYRLQFIGMQLLMESIIFHNSCFLGYVNIFQKALPEYKRSSITDLAMPLLFCIQKLYSIFQDISSHTVQYRTVVSVPLPLAFPLQ